MGLAIKKAVKHECKLRMALYGPSGSGKTYTALAIAHAMKGDKKVCVIDTERGSASKYADNFPEYDVIELDNFHPHTYVEAINLIVRTHEYSVLIIDSITHEWDGSKGALEQAGQDFRNWAKVTPLHNAFIDAMMSASIHIIATMRAKEEHVMEQVEGKAKPQVRSVGIEPIQRKGVQYEFDVVSSLDIDNTLTVVKTRCSALQGAIYYKAGKAMADILSLWLAGAPLPSRTVSSDRLNSIYSRGKALGYLFNNIDEFSEYITRELALDVPLFPKDMNEDQANDIEARIIACERQSGPSESADATVTEQQVASIRKLCQHLGKSEPDNVTSISYLAAKRLIQQLTAEYKASRQNQAS